MANNDFQFFPCLAPEIRHMIWEFCLPSRVAEEDPPSVLLDGKMGRQACFATHENTKLPAIAFINRESRHVALRKGRRYQVEATMDEKPPMWFQPHQDTLHLNYAGEASYDESHETSFLPIYNPVPRFLHRTYRQSFNISVTADLIHPFKLKKLTECFDESTFSDENSEAYSWDGYLYNIDEMQELAMFLYNVGFPQKLNVAMLAISLHIDIEAARRSGIFGLLGDAPVQMIDVLDIRRLEEFEALFNAHALKKEDEHVQTLFKLCKSSRFFEAIDSWERKAEIAILTTILHNEVNAGEYTGETVDDHRDWAMENRNIVPELVPQIMIRYCANKCYDREWLREISHVS